MTNREQTARDRWDKMTPAERCFKLFKAIDKNTRGLAKITSAVLYWTTDEHEVDVLRQLPAQTVQEVAPDLLKLMRDLYRERRMLRQSLETQLAEDRKLKQAAAAIQVGRR